MPARIIARLAGIAAIALCTFGYTSCSVGDSSEFPGDDDDIGGGSFRVTLMLRDSYGVATTSFVMGEPIRFDLEVLNRRPRRASLQFADGQIYDVHVYAADGSQVLWRWGADKAFPQVVTTLEFLPDSSKLYSVQWDGVLPDGTQLPAGSYRARAVVVANDPSDGPTTSGGLVSPFVNFTVR